MTQNNTEIVQDIYNAAIEFGCTKKEAQRLSLKKLQVLEEHDMQALEEATSIRRTIPLFYLKGWNGLSPKQKQDKLWEMGVDVTLPWWEDVCIIRERGRPSVLECVVGSERTDRQWVTLTLPNGEKVASWAAQVRASRDTSLDKELGRLSGGHIYG